MFSGLRQNSLFYILEKGEEPTLKVGQVVSVSNPQPKFGTFSPQFGAAQNMESVVDVTVNVDGENVEFKQLPANLSIANFGQKGVVVSESREAMLAEVEAMSRTSKGVLDSIDYHRRVVESCEGMMETLNPQFAKEREQEKKIGILENRITGMEGTLSDIHSMMAEFLNGKSQTPKK